MRYFLLAAVVVYAGSVHASDKGIESEAKLSGDSTYDTKGTSAVNTSVGYSTSSGSSDVKVSSGRGKPACQLKFKMAPVRVQKTGKKCNSKGWSCRTYTYTETQTQERPYLVCN